MKKHLSLLIIAMLFSIISAFAQDCDYFGTTGELQWCLKSGTLIISGEGEMPDYFLNAPWKKYGYNIHTVVIESGVTSIGKWAFWDINITSMFIPKNIASIGNSAFSDCRFLTSFEVESENIYYTSKNGVLFNQDKTAIICYPAGKGDEYVIPNSVTHIGNYAFESCDNLISITIPESVTNIGEGAFRACTNLTLMIIPDNVISIGLGAFIGCTSLSSMVIPNSVISIGECAFCGCINLMSIIISNQITTIEMYTFSSCEGLTSITIPKGVNSIDPYAFQYCENLTSITNLNPVPVAINSDVFMGVTQNTCTLRVPTSSVQAYKDADIWKNFNIIGGDYHVQVIADNNTHGYTIGDGLYATNEIATVTAIAKFDYKFANWTKEGIEVSTNNPYSFTVTEDMELVANFENNVDIKNTEVAAVKIYPNPTAGELKIESGELKIENVKIIDIHGRNLSHHQSIPSSSHKMNISHLPAGIYFVKISTTTGEIFRKVVRE